MQPSDVCKFLNEILELDPGLMRTVFAFRPACSQVLADHPTVQVRQVAGNYLVGILGLLNGLIGKFYEEVLVATYDEKQTLIRFELWNKERCGMSGKEQ